MPKPILVANFCVAVMVKQRVLSNMQLLP
jgi:hypothetical protein